MDSLYEQLTRKLQQDPRLTRRGGPRFDPGLLLFNARDTLFQLWQAADGLVAQGHAPEDLRAAVDQLRPIFGERRP